MTREELIEEAAATIAVAELVSTRRTWGELLEPQKGEYRRVASAVLAVFEKAQTPADEEREDMIAWLMRDHGDELSPLGRDYTDAEIADMLRRPAQTEPTDAQVIAALNAYWGESATEYGSREGMRAALKAAFIAGQEEQS